MNHTMTRQQAFCQLAGFFLLYCLQRHLDQCLQKIILIIHRKKFLISMEHFSQRFFGIYLSFERPLFDEVLVIAIRIENQQESRLISSLIRNIQFLLDRSNQLSFHRRIMSQSSNDQNTYCFSPINQSLGGYILRKNESLFLFLCCFFSS